MRCNVGDWIYVKDRLPEELAPPLWVACRAIDGSRPNWVACGVLYSHNNITENPWGIPILDDDNYEAYAWMYEWYPNPPKEMEEKHGRE